MSRVLECSGLAVGYEGKTVLENVGFELAAGEILALLGPNGGGKSTLLKTLSGILPIQSGTVNLRGRDLRGLNIREIARSIAFVPQEEGWRFRFLAEEVVAMGRLPISNGFFDTEEDLQAADQAMKDAGCLELKGRFVTELSGGERQRVLIARALAQDTPVIFLDEPTSHLDPRYQVETASLLRKLARSGKSLLVAVHDLPIAGVIADRAMLVAHGTASQPQKTDELLAGKELEHAYGTEFERILAADRGVVVVPRIRS